MGNQDTAVARRVETEPYQVRVGIVRASGEKKGDVALAAKPRAGFEPMGVDPSDDFIAAPKPELNGKLYRLQANTPEVYLIDRGLRRFVPNSATFENLFRRWEDVKVEPKLVD